jgi:hypothetical protein
MKEPMYTNLEEANNKIQELSKRCKKSDNLSIIVMICLVYCGVMGAWRDWEKDKKINKLESELISIQEDLSKDYIINWEATNKNSKEKNPVFKVSDGEYTKGGIYSIIDDGKSNYNSGSCSLYRKQEDGTFKRQIILHVPSKVK